MSPKIKCSRLTNHVALSSKSFIVFQFSVRPLGKLIYRIIDSKVQQIDIVFWSIILSYLFAKQSQFKSIQRSVGGWYLALSCLHYHFTIMCHCAIRQAMQLSDFMQKIKCLFDEKSLQIISLFKRTLNDPQQDVLKITFFKNKKQ